MTRYLALFGSINVGGNRLKMADLRYAFEREEFENVETVVASGAWDKTAPGPELPAEVTERAIARYLEAYHLLTGEHLTL